MDNHEATTTERAYDIWIAEGCPAGMDYPQWMQTWHEPQGTMTNGETDDSRDLLSTDRSSGPETCQQDQRRTVA